MTRNRRLLLGLAAAGCLATLAMGQIGRVTWNGGTGPIFTDRSFGVEIAVRQLWSHAQALESEVVRQRADVAQLEKELDAEKAKTAKLEKRVRAMELRGK